MIPRSPGPLPPLVLAVALVSGCLAHTPAIPGPDGRCADPLEAPADERAGIYEASDHTPILAKPDRSRGEMVRVGGEAFVPDRSRRSVVDESTGSDPDGQRTERVILPFLLYSPETKLGGGLVAGGYRRLQPILPTSSVLGAVTVTSRRQLSVEAVSEIHRPGGGRLNGSLRFQHYPDQFFGVGPGTPDEAEESYTSRIFHAGFRGQRRVRPGLQIGPEVTFRWEDVVETEEEGLLAEGDLTASDGGRWFGIGGAATYDTRDHVVNPRQGAYVVLSALTFPDALGTTGYRSALLDGRRYLALGTASTVALRGYLEGAWGEVPVLLLPSLGGQERLRGYYEGRVRDRAAGVAQGEVRFPLWWRFGGAAFAEAGQVGPGAGELASGRIEGSAGAGLRFRLGEEAAPIRLDFAVGRRGSGFYLTIGEAF